MTVSGLAEFLLARISEDADDLCHCCDEGIGTRVGFARAECQAKRRIVAECSGELVARPVSPRARWLAGYTLMQLALPWADHPDYDEDWRP